MIRDFLSHPVVKIPHFQCQGYGFISDQGIKIPYARELKPHMQQKKKKRHDQLVNILLTGWWWGIGSPTGLRSPCLWQHTVNFSHLVGVLVSTKQFKDTVLHIYIYIYIYIPPLKGNQDLAPRLYYCFLTFPPFSLHPLPSLISNCFNLPIGTHRRSWRLNKAYFLLTRKQGTQKDFCTQDPLPNSGSCLVLPSGCLWLWKCVQLGSEKWCEVKVTQLCPTLCDPMGYTVHRILQDLRSHGGKCPQGNGLWDRAVSVGEES